MDFNLGHILVVVYKSVIFHLVNCKAVAFQLLLLQEVSLSHVDVLKGVKDLLIFRICNNDNDVNVENALLF